MADNTDTNVYGCGLKLTYEGESSGSAYQEGVLKEQDHLLPIANVGRIMKQILPPNAKISKEAKETMQECVSEFVSFVTGEASDKCRKEKRKTLNGDDICWALGSLGFDDYAETTKRYLLRYREFESEKANQNRTGNNEQNDIEPPRSNPAVSDTANTTTSDTANTTTTTIIFDL
ncbi:hypothetical protein QQ045_029708 [Rhodiola kirilowii]